MRASIRLLARFVEPGTSTGLTGLRSRAAPRATLLNLYQATLDKLQAVPPTSVYRQSVEAVTRHRAELVRAMTPVQPSTGVEKIRWQDSYAVQQDEDVEKIVEQPDLTAEQ
jgi:NADH dehydrogenase (ubiquinone) 1 alpha subcomplex subunit 5